MMGLTPMQSKTLAAVRRLTRQGVAPSYEELCEDLGLASKSGLSRLLNALRARGAIDFTPNLARSLRIVGQFDGLAEMSTAELDVLKARVEAELGRRAQ